MTTSSSTIVQRVWNYCNVLRDERLRQSILKRAFEGKLVAQNASDEPAGVLLERIRVDDVAHYNIARWKALAHADASPARQKFDPEGRLGEFAGRLVLCIW